MNVTLPICDAVLVVLRDAADGKSSDGCAQRLTRELDLRGVLDFLAPRYVAHLVEVIDPQ